MPFRPSLAQLAALATAGASLALVACGGSASGSAASREKDREQALVKFAQCMREHGVNVSTPTGAAGAIKITGTAGAANPHSLEAAQDACKRYQPSGGKQSISPAERAALEDASLKFAQCMRSHGVNVPNPTTSAGGAGFSIRIQGGPGSVNPSSPNFQAAQKACQGLLPKPPGGKGPGLSTNGPSSPGSGQSLGLSAGG
jgi:hypothetical protein